MVAGVRALITAFLAAAVREGIGSAGVIYMEAPFRVNAASPLFSPVLLAGASDGSGRPGAEHLETRELFNLSARAALVTFADPAALSMRDAAAALTSIYWAWRAAGVRTIAVRRWGGVETSGLDGIRALHESLRAGATPADAWFAARKALGVAGNRPAPGPWAAWVLIGDR